jgi:hypothetical protein
MKNFEMFYDFCGQFDELLKKDYKKSKAKANGVTYPQFCIGVFANFIDTANELLNTKPKKKKK